MDIYRCLKQDHAWQRELAYQIMETNADDPDRQKLYDRFRREVESHAMAEEQTLYLVGLCAPECHLMARRGIFGHQKISDQFRELDKIPISSDAWLETFSRLRGDLEHFSCEEEEFLFPAARRHLDHSSATEMATDYAARKSAGLGARFPGVIDLHSVSRAPAGLHTPH